MMRDYFKKRPDMGLSVALHAFFFFALIAFALLRSCTTEPPVYVFELTELSQTASTEKERPAPQVQSQNQPESVPTQRMQIDDFLKEHPRSPNRPKPEPDSKKSSQNRIEQFDTLPKFRVESTQSSQNQQSSEMERSALQAYGLSIHRRINSQWTQPRFKTEEDFSVEVAFTVLANGMVSDVRLIKRSGSAIFDRSILSVFKEIGRFEPTPSQKKERFQMMFKLH